MALRPQATLYVLYHVCPFRRCKPRCVAPELDRFIAAKGVVQQYYCSREASGIVTTSRVSDVVSVTVPNPEQTMLMPVSVEILLEFTAQVSA